MRIEKDIEESKVIDDDFLGEQAKEFLIDVTGLNKQNTNNLIVALVQAGYEVYFDWEKENLIFRGFPEVVCPSLVKKQKDI